MKRCHYGNWLLIKSFFYPDCHVLLDVGTERLERLLHDRSRRYFCFQLLLFRFPRHPGQKYKQESPDEMAEANLRRCDAICLKISVAAFIVIGFTCAVGRMVLTTEIIGYGLMAALILISVVRTIIFYLMDKKGL